MHGYAINCIFEVVGWRSVGKLQHDGVPNIYLLGTLEGMGVFSPREHFCFATYSVEGCQLQCLYVVFQRTSLNSSDFALCCVR